MRRSIPVTITCLALCLMLSTHLSAQQTNSAADAKKHEEMMAIIMTKPKYPIKTIGIYVYDGFNTLDAIGPYQTLSQIQGAKVMMIAKKKGMVKNQGGLNIEVTRSIDEVSKLDILVIPGGAVETFRQTLDTAVLQWIRKIDSNSVYTTSVCTGAWILGATGLLRDRKATTNWYRAAEMMTMYGAKFQQERYVQDGKYWTSAGVTAGIDMSLAIIYDLMGKQYTQGVMMDLEYNPKPPIQGGTVASSDPIVAEMMKTMYDLVMLPLIEKEQKKRAK